MATTAPLDQRKLITLNSMNPNVIKMEFATRGPISLRASEIEMELLQGAKKPFTQIIRANSGDSRAMEQPYITFVRDVLALLIDPSNFNESKYPHDAKERARAILNSCAGNSIGAYSDADGIEIIRKHAAEYISHRDGGIPASYENIYLSSGASQSIKAVMQLLSNPSDGLSTGILIPIPQYPLFSATIVEYGMQQIDYYLNEDKNWSLDTDELETSLKTVPSSCVPRAIVVINPGNPTGQVLTKENIQQIIKFAYTHSLCIIADEVYQDMVYDKNSKFHSFKKVLSELGEPYNTVQLASFMSCSKGYMGDCGLRGGYCEFINLSPTVREMFHKLLSGQFCPTTLGQAAIDVLVNPPKEDEPSYDLFQKQKCQVLNAFKEHAKLMAQMFNSLEGFACKPVQGAMYAFPRITLPPKAIEAAEAEGKAIDTFYTFQLLEATGICVVAGTGFGQKPNTYHFRTTIPPQRMKLNDMLTKFQDFHIAFMKKYK